MTIPRPVWIDGNQAINEEKDRLERERIEAENIKSNKKRKHIAMPSDGDPIDD